MRPFFFTTVLSIFSCSGLSAMACDACKLSPADPDLGGGGGQTARVQDGDFKWTSDTSFEYRNFARMPARAAHRLHHQGHDVHDLVDDFYVTERIGFAITQDLGVGITQGFRHLRQIEIDDHHRLGEHDFADGATDLELDIKYRFMKQKDKGFPVDLAFFASVKAPTGQKRERTPTGELLEAENQPGTGSWDGTFGVALSRRWGNAWGTSASISYTVKGKGSQEFKAGDVLRVSAGASRRITPETFAWKLFANLGAQGVVENKGREEGEVSRDHGGQTIFVIPGISAQPIKRLTLGVSGTVPVYQELNGKHQKQDYGLHFGASVRF